MQITPPAALDAALAQIDTPALLIDLDAFERNLQRMADAARAAGVRLRPHAKTHKSPIIAQQQMARGAVGVCCQKVSEAEVMVAGGIADVLVSNEVTGGSKLDRLARLARHARIAVCADHPESVGELEAAARSAGTRLRVLVEIDVGGRRCGLTPGEPAARLAQQIARCAHLDFAGLQAYHGAAQHVREAEERRQAIAGSIACVRETQRALQALGLAAATISGAGTGTFEHEAGSALYNELQPGSYIFMDADYARNRRADGGPYDAFEHALFVYASVMSTPVPGRLILDAGHKAVSVDSGMPLAWKLPGAAYQRPSDEHGILQVATGVECPARGEKVLLVPGHCDPTVNLHDWYVGVRGLHSVDARVECLWPVAARGALF
jgi:D-serine deaminase-like pyridoxal phosphate-dependent protein